MSLQASICPNDVAAFSGDQAAQQQGGSTEPRYAVYSDRTQRLAVLSGSEEQQVFCEITAASAYQDITCLQGREELSAASELMLALCLATQVQLNAAAWDLLVVARLLQIGNVW